MNRIKTILFGTSPTMNTIKPMLRKSKKYKIIGDYKNPNENKETAADVDLIVVSSDLFYNDEDAMEDIEKRYLMRGCLLRTDFYMYDKIFNRVPLEGLKDFKWIIRRVSFRNESYNRDIIKRAFDIVVSSCMILVLLLPMLITWLLIKLIDGYDPIFKQVRIGMHGNPIVIYKFRTMTPKTEDVTRLGAILRRFRIDEFPQIFNIQMGDISFVGPRPIYIMENTHLNMHVHNHSLRTFVRPGLTGWAQLNFKAPPTYCVQDLPENMPDELVYKDAYTRLSYDLWYIENRSLLLDLKILLYTLKRAFIKDSSFKS